MVRGQLINGGGSIRDNLELPFLAHSGTKPCLSRAKMSYLVAMMTSFKNNHLAPTRGKSDHRDV